MPFGTIQLAAYNDEDIHLTFRPDITFFKKIYKRHSMFSSEARQQYFSSVTNFGLSSSCIIAMNGDLLGNVYLSGTLPYINVPRTYSNTKLDSFCKFRFVDYPGIAMIKNASLEVNGKTISSMDNKYIYSQLVLSNFNNIGEKRNHTKGLNKLTGHVEELLRYNTNVNSHSINIPIPFYFTRSSSSSLPLIALQKSEVKINIEFNQLKDILIYGPTHCIDIKQTGYCIQNNFFSMTGDSNSKRIKVYGVDSDSYSYKSLLYFNFEFGQFPLEIDMTLQDSEGCEITIYGNLQQSGINENYTGNAGCEMTCEYIYLSNRERKLFASREHHYLMEEVSIIRKLNITSNYNRINIGLKNIAIELLVMGTLNTWEYSKECFKTLDKHKSIVKSIGLTVNGSEILSLQDSIVTQYVTKYETHSTAFIDNGIHCIPFSLAPEIQSISGYLNMSQYDDIKLELKMRNDVSETNPANLYVYVRSINFLYIHDGIAELVFTN